MGTTLSKALLLASVATTSIATYAAFTKHEIGEGAFTAGGSVGDILDNFLAGDISLTDLAAISTAFGSADTFSYSANPSLAVFDEDNDGTISEQEFANILANMASIMNVNVSDDGIYAQAYATELSSMTSPITATQIQAAITQGNSYAVNEPDIATSSLTFTGTDSSHSGGLGIVDGLNDAMSSGDAEVVVTVTASHASDTNAMNRFDIDTNGNLILSSGTDIEDLEPGVYTVSVNVVDNNALTYGLSDSADISLTVSNEKGCIINNGIASGNFSAGSGNISGATVTISGNHDSSDKLFVRTSTSISTDSITGNVTYSGFGVSGITAEYQTASGELVFSGTTSLANWISIFKKVGYIYDTTDSLEDNTRSLIFSLSNKVPYNHPSGTDHFYEFISGTLTFQAAREAADASTLFGLQGYLATVTSQAEQTYIEPKIGGYGWMGACDRLQNTTVQTRCGLTQTEATALYKPTNTWLASNGDYSVGDGEGYWYWISGPERLSFMGHDKGNSSSNCRQRTYARGSDVFDTANSQESYENFKGSEPNHYLGGCGNPPGGGEDHLHFYSDGTWNDYANNASSITGYLVEYGGMTGDPTVDLTEDKTYNIVNEGTYCAYQ